MTVSLSHVQLEPFHLTLREATLDGLNPSSSKASPARRNGSSSGSSWGVTGIGPRIALQVLTKLTPAQFCQALLNKRVEELERVKGIGRKMAERLILELRGRLPKAALAEEPTAVFSDRTEPAFRAPRSLGFTATEARRAAERAQAQAQAYGGELPLEELVKRALELVRG